MSPPLLFLHFPEPIQDQAEEAGTGCGVESPAEMQAALRTGSVAPCVSGKPGELERGRSGDMASGRVGEATDVKEETVRIEEVVLVRAADRDASSGGGDEPAAGIARDLPPATALRGGTLDDARCRSGALAGMTGTLLPKSPPLARVFVRG